jgi:alpha-tubulin suppressor-like RCC1 family protein
MRLLFALSLSLVACGSSSSSSGVAADGGVTDGVADAHDHDAMLPLADISCVESVALAHQAPFCAILRDHSLWCSADNFNGGLGIGDSYEFTSTGNRFLKLGDDFASVSAASGYRVCAIKRDGTLLCWGGNPDDYLGLGAEAILSPTAPKSLPGKFAELHYGAYNSCARRTDGAVFCWGRTAKGESKTPVVVDGLGSDVVEIAAGAETSYALKSDGSVWTWGGGSFGELGMGESVKNLDVPTKIEGFADVAHVIGGGNHVCAIKKDGSLWCWGTNGYGEAVPGGGSPIWVPTKVAAITLPVKSVSLDNTTCAVTSDGMTYCFGDPFGNSLGGSSVTATTATPASAPAGLSTFVSVGELDACVVRFDGSVRCWGATRFSDGKDPNGPVDVAGPCK